MLRTNRTYDFALWIVAVLSIFLAPSANAYAATVLFRGTVTSLDGVFDDNEIEVGAEISGQYEINVYTFVQSVSFSIESLGDVFHYSSINTYSPEEVARVDLYDGAELSMVTDVYEILVYPRDLADIWDGPGLGSIGWRPREFSLHFEDDTGQFIDGEYFNFVDEYAAIPVPLDELSLAAGQVSFHLPITTVTAFFTIGELQIVPEPTSGALAVFLGAPLLALRRHSRRNQGK